MSQTMTSGAALSSKIDAKRNGKLIHDGRQVDVDVAASPASDTAETTASDAVLNAAAASADPGTLDAALNESIARTAGLIGKLLDATSLMEHVSVGLSALATLKIAKSMQDAIGERNRTTSDWSEARYDDVCSQISNKVEVLCPHLFMANKERNDESEAKGKRRDPIHVQDYVLVAMVVGLLKPIVGDGVETLSYRLIINYLARNVASLSKKKLHCKIKEGWAEWIRINVGRRIRDEITVGNLIEAMKEHGTKLAEAEKRKKLVGKSEDDITAMEAEAERKKTVRELDARVKKNAANLDAALFDAMEGLMKPKTIVEHIHAIARETKCDLGLTIDPANITAPEMLKTLRSMVAMERYDEVRAICQACAKLAATIDVFDPPKPVAIAS